MTKKRTKEEQAAYMREYRARQKAAKATAIEPVTNPPDSQPADWTAEPQAVTELRDPYRAFNPWPKPSVRKKS